MSDSQKTILLVEDEPIMAILEKRMLERNSYEVIIAETGEKAVETVKDNPDTDLILMDIDLGEGIDGTEAAEIILKDYDLPLVFLSSHTEPEVVEKTEGITSYGYIVKNSGETVLMASIRMAFKLFDSKVKEQKKEKVLRESEERFRNLVDTVNSGVAIYKVINDGNSGSDFIIQDFNQFALKHENINKEDVVGKSLKDIRSNIDEYGLIDVFRKVWKTGELTHFPAKMYVDENFSNYYENRVFKLPSGEIVAIYDDVTEMYNLRQKLKEDLNLKNSLHNTIPNPIFYKDLNLKYIGCNKAFEKFFGKSSDEIVGKTVYDLEPKEIAQKYDETDRELLENKIPQRYEWVVKTSSGEYRDVVFYKSLFNDQDGNPAGILGVIEDITER